jgi:hypothetical protein
MLISGIAIGIVSNKLKDEKLKYLYLNDQFSECAKFSDKHLDKAIS